MPGVQYLYLSFVFAGYVLLTAPSHHIIIAAFQLNYIDQLELSKIVKNEEYTVDNMYTSYVFPFTVPYKNHRVHSLLQRSSYRLHTLHTFVMISSAHWSENRSQGLTVCA